MMPVLSIDPYGTHDPGHLSEIYLYLQLNTPIRLVHGRGPKLRVTLYNNKVFVTVCSKINSEINKGCSWPRPSEPVYLPV